ncbi:MAG: radical SAM protein [Acidimicrobiia bacterium]|nr:radical SAM protein [Acidimicrobiia bacterium]
MRRTPGVRWVDGDAGLDAAAVAAAFPAPAGAYLHVPFCERICPFCPYNKVPYRPERAATYFAALRREAGAYLDAGAGPFTSLYVGGGTPTLCLDLLEEIVAALPILGERAIEVLPAHATPAGVARLRQAGFDRVSLGVQSFDDRALHHLGRAGSGAENRAALEACRGKFDCLDVDLIFDTGFDDPGVFLADVEECCRAGVDQISTYPLMRFGYTPFGKARHAPRQEHDLLRRAADLAAGYGYGRSSVWGLRRRDSPGFSSITREFYLGLGAGAASFAGPYYLVNHFSPERYAAALAAGRLPIARTARLGRRAGAAYYLFWQAYAGGFHPARARALFPGAGGLVGAASGLARLLGWGERTAGGRVALTGRGLDRFHDLERWVTYRFIEPLWADMMAEHEAPRPPPAPSVE